MQIKVSLVEDNAPLARELEQWINGTKDLKCLSVYPSAEAALKSLPTERPDIMLVDLRLPGMSGVDFIKKLKTLCPDVQCLVLTMYAENELIFEALKAGACGYLLKRIKSSEIADAIRQVHAGGSVMTPRIARRVLETFANPPSVKASQPEDHQLNDRERSVLQVMAQGMVRKQIVDQLDVNSHTLDYVIRCIYRKLHVNCAAAAVSIAVRDGIATPKK